VRTARGSARESAGPRAGSYRRRLEQPQSGPIRNQVFTGGLAYRGLPAPRSAQPGRARECV